jgi:methylenetetrahydrofolate dehydrogenase (NADP+)/methenyltetrahydrofolate cyclohydrolase
MREDLKVLQDKIRIYSHRGDVSGVLIQKPTKEVWMQTTGIHDPIKFDAWWQQLIGVLDAKKDVDCLTNENLGRVYLGKWMLLPATVKAVLLILREALGGEGVSGRKIAVIGRSELVGRPLAAVLESYGAYVGLFGASNMDRKAICQADVVISATGVPKLVTEDLIKEGDIVIDVGAPKGDVDFESVVKKAGFITPVPGGVGPVTVVSLLENLVELVKMR